MVSCPSDDSIFQRVVDGSHAQGIGGGEKDKESDTRVVSETSTSRPRDQKRKWTTGEPS